MYWFPDYRLFPIELAQEYNALVLTLEHRFYGASQPFDIWDTDNLRYHTTDQALVDTANFIQQMKAQLADETGRSDDIPFFMFGASYPGAFVAFFQTKFPHLVKGTVASSAVVNPIIDFWQFDHHLTQVIPDYCIDAIHASTYRLEDTYPDCKADYNADDLNMFDFFYMMADTHVGLVQYGNQSSLCDRFSTILPEDYNSYSDYQDAVMVEWNDVFFNVVAPDPQDYNQEHLADTTIVQSDSSRCWWWQKATQLPYYQTYLDETSLRSYSVDLEGHFDRVSYIYGLDRSLFSENGPFPDAARTIREFGGVGLKGQKISFVNGHDDPWIEAGYTETDDFYLRPSQVVFSYQAGHACDLVTPTDDDSFLLQEARHTEEDYIRRWINEIW
eukprot:gnl/Carplike_NY0171/3030_a4075_372.p1 GENE.gnl/Carplike_NY0171/3030_a4075_372~~gnl/Carplike_NY0171/3030_a4075_372.p1  ORF type:complete len:387 (-),score=79.04 gnl/Carplike_NY0171/3030_a4075_372:229-1389(-)